VTPIRCCSVLSTNRRKTSRSDTAVRAASRRSTLRPEPAPVPSLSVGMVGKIAGPAAAGLGHGSTWPSSADPQTTAGWRAGPQRRPQGRRRAAAGADRSCVAARASVLRHREATLPGHSDEAGPNRTPVNYGDWRCCCCCGGGGGGNGGCVERQERSRVAHCRRDGCRFWAGPDFDARHRHV
jgi:hypothetical protein